MTIYHMLISGELYHDLGPDHFDRTAKATQTKARRYALAKSRLRRPDDPFGGVTGVLSLSSM
jgi:hypothetical protein